MERRVIIADRETVVDLTDAGGTISATAGELTTDLKVVPISETEAEIFIGGERHVVPFLQSGERIHFLFRGETITAEVSTNARKSSRQREHSMASPMPGAVTRILVSHGDAVTKGTPLLVLEAMKMEHVIVAPYDGTVEAIHCAAGELVQPGFDLVTVTGKPE